MVAGDWGSLDDHGLRHSGSILLPVAAGWTVARDSCQPTASRAFRRLLLSTFGARFAEISRRLEHRFPIDLLVRSPEELRQRLEWNDFILKEATEKGVVMYDAVDARVD